MKLLPCSNFQRNGVNVFQLRAYIERISTSLECKAVEIIEL